VFVKSACAAGKQKAAQCEWRENNRACKVGLFAKSGTVQSRRVRKVGRAVGKQEAVRRVVRAGKTMFTGERPLLFKFASASV
jgi:hypothetical protein